MALDPSDWLVDNRQLSLWLWVPDGYEPQGFAVHHRSGGGHSEAGLESNLT
jgi:hypothetical protein